MLTKESLFRKKFCYTNPFVCGVYMKWKYCRNNEFDYWIQRGTVGRRYIFDHNCRIFTIDKSQHLKYKWPRQSWERRSIKFNQSIIYYETQNCYRRYETVQYLEYQRSQSIEKRCTYNFDRICSSPFLCCQKHIIRNSYNIFW